MDELSISTKKVSYRESFVQHMILDKTNLNSLALRAKGMSQHQRGSPIPEASSTGKLQFKESRKLKDVVVYDHTRVIVHMD